MADFGAAGGASESNRKHAPSLPPPQRIARAAQVTCASISVPESLSDLIQRGGKHSLDINVCRTRGLSFLLPVNLLLGA